MKISSYNYEGSQSPLIFQKYQRKWSRVQKEFIATIVIQAIENILLVSPMIHLFLNTTERHQFLKSTIGPIHLEIEAINTIGLLVQYSACSVVLLLPLQVALFWAYNLFGHPWKRFLNQLYKKEDVQLYGRIIQADKSVTVKLDDETTNCIGTLKDTVIDVTPDPSMDSIEEQHFKPHTGQLELDIEHLENIKNAPDCIVHVEEEIDQKELEENIQKIIVTQDNESTKDISDRTLNDNSMDVITHSPPHIIGEQDFKTNQNQLALDIEPVENTKRPLDGGIPVEEVVEQKELGENMVKSIVARDNESTKGTSDKPINDASMDVVPDPSLDIQGEQDLEANTGQLLLDTELLEPIKKASSCLLPVEEVIDQKEIREIFPKSVAMQNNESTHGINDKTLNDTSMDVIPHSPPDNIGEQDFEANPSQLALDIETLENTKKAIDCINPVETVIDQKERRENVINSIVIQKDESMKGVSDRTLKDTSIDLIPEPPPDISREEYFGDSTSQLALDIEALEKTKKF